MSKQLIGIIDIGSTTARLKLFELGNKAKPKEIETVRSYIELGSKSFVAGKIMPEEVDELCECLTLFRSKCKEYRVKNVICVATSAIRDASNRDVVLEQIKVRTGFDIKVLDNSMERFYHNLSVKESLASEVGIGIFDEGTMMLDIGADSMQASVYDKGELVFSQNTVLGSLRISGLLSDISNRTTHYEEVLEEFINQDLDDYHAVEPKGITYRNLIAFGGDIGFIKQLAGYKPYENIVMTKKEFSKVYDYLLKARPSDITLERNVPSFISPLLLPTALIIRNMLEYTTLDKIIMPNASLSDGVAYMHAATSFGYELAKNPEDELLSAAKNIAKRFKSSKKHINFVETVSLQLYDSTSKYNGLGARERLLLRVSAILHEIGKYVNARNHNDSALFLIKYAELIGLDKIELDTIGLVVRLYPLANPYSDGFYATLDSKRKVLVSKLTAILRIADALDSSHKNKSDDIQMSMEDETLTIKIDTSEDMSFEKWSFDHRSKLLEEVLGIKVKLKIRRKL